MLNTILKIVVLLVAVGAVYYFIRSKQKQKVEETIEMDDKTYTLERMTAFVKQRLNEITKVNLYDIGLSEEELKRRKKSMRALKTCMIVLDVIAIILLFIQIFITKEITWISYVALIICNILTFSVKVENSRDIKLNKKTSKKK